MQPLIDTFVCYSYKMKNCACRVNEGDNLCDANGFCLHLLVSSSIELTRLNNIKLSNPCLHEGKYFSG